ncbi:hypothetical protein BDR04DRAFT_678906 [Suillus decipiens]|nr:hypothetical protein BDR04DRAFT_678906 [Suillus decipiens]
MTSRRVHTTGEIVQASSVQPPTHSRAEISGALKRLGLGRHLEEDVEREFGDIYPTKRICAGTQEEQDEADEEARKRAMKHLVDSWQERLQLISVITTFFASIEAGMLAPVNTVPNVVNAPPGLVKAANAGFLGALVMHVYAAVLSFLAAFLLIRYKLKEASNEELFAEGRAKGFQITSPVNGSTYVEDIERDAQNNDAQTFDRPQTDTSDNNADTKHDHPALPRMGSTPAEPPIFARDPHLEQVGFWNVTISSHLLSRVHALCIFFAGIGFVLAIMGVIMYAWALQPKEVSIFVSVCFGVAVFAMGVLFLPDL